jgi:hypothetical protein
VAGVPDVATALLAPLSGDPNGPAMRRTHVSSGNPNVAVSIPAVVAGNPDPVAVYGRGLWDDFDGARRRRADADNDLRVGSANGEKEGAGCGKDLSLHGRVAPWNCSSIRCGLQRKVVRVYFPFIDAYGARERREMSDDGSSMK